MKKKILTLLSTSFVPIAFIPTISTKCKRKEENKNTEDIYVNEIQLKELKDLIQIANQKQNLINDKYPILIEKVNLIFNDIESIAKTLNEFLKLEAFISTKNKLQQKLSILDKSIQNLNNEPKENAKNQIELAKKYLENIVPNPTFRKSKNKLHKVINETQDLISHESDHHIIENQLKNLNYEISEFKEIIAKEKTKLEDKYKRNISLNNLNKSIQKANLLIANLIDKSVLETKLEDLIPELTTAKQDAEYKSKIKGLTIEKIIDANKTLNIVIENTLKKKYGILGLDKSIKEKKLELIAIIEEANDLITNLDKYYSENKKIYQKLINAITKASNEKHNNDFNVLQNAIQKLSDSIKEFELVLDIAELKNDLGKQIKKIQKEALNNFSESRFKDLQKYLFKAIDKARIIFKKQDTTFLEIDETIVNLDYFLKEAQMLKEMRLLNDAILEAKKFIDIDLKNSNIEPSNKITIEKQINRKIQEANIELEKIDRNAKHLKQERENLLNEIASQKSKLL